VLSQTPCGQIGDDITTPSVELSVHTEQPPTGPTETDAHAKHDEDGSQSDSADSSLEAENTTYSGDSKSYQGKLETSSSS
jgi:hypothetical protein